MVPLSTRKRLARQTQSVRLRLERARELVRQLEGQLTALEEAEAALAAPPNGKKPKLPDFLQDVPVSQRDRVLAIIRSRPKSGSSRQLIAEKLAKGGHPVGINSISTYLSDLRRDSLVRAEHGLWFPT